MASASPVCWGEGGGGGGKRIKLFGTWVQGPAVRDVSGLEDDGSHGDGGPQLQGGEQKLLELREPEVLRGEDQPRPLQQEGEQGDCMEGEEGGRYGKGDDPQGRAPHPHGADNSVVTYSFLHSQRTPDKNIGNPWTVEEHRRFLKGLAEKGKGHWRAIAREFVKTRTPTQVATHAQKYFLRQGTLPRRRHSSIFDVALDAGDAGTGVLPHERRAAQGGGEGGSRSQSPSPLPELALSLAPPSPAATSQPRRPSQPPSQPTPSARKVAPLRSEASAGVPAAAPMLHLARYAAARAAPFFPWNGVFAWPAVERASPWPALWLTHHSFATSAQELQRLFSVATSSLGKGGEKDGADLATVA